MNSCEKKSDIAFSKPFLREFLELYKSMPCLWDPKCKEYTNKLLRKRGYIRLIRKCQEIDKSANKDVVVKKINSLRTTFRRVLRKVVESREKGGSPYQPSLWYFPLMLFLVDQEEPTSTNKDMIEEDYEHDQDFKNKDHYENPFHSHFLDESEYHSPSETEEEPVRSKRKLLLKKEDINRLTEYYEEDDDSSTNNISYNNIDECDALAKVISVRMKKMSNDQQIIAEKLISDILFHGQLNELTTRTRVVLHANPTELIDRQYITITKSDE